MPALRGMPGNMNLTKTFSRGVWAHKFLYLCTMKRFLIVMALLLPLMCTARQLRPLVWVLDAGHGGKDQGTCTRNVLEKDLTLKLTNRVAELIRKNKPGIKLILTRTDDSFVSLDERCRIANKARADLFLSIHINFAERNILLSGTETFYANRRAAQNMVQASHLERNADKSELLAWLLQKNYAGSGRPADRGARSCKLYVLLHTEMPAVLTEVGFLSNVNDAAYMCSERGQKQIAQDIYNALNEYYITTQAKTHKQTLRKLRQSFSTMNGLKANRLCDDNTPTGEQSETESAVEENRPALPEEHPTNEQPDSPQPEMAQEIPAVQADTVPVFSVQLLAVSKELHEGDPRLKGLSPVRIVQAGAAYKVLYGSTPDYSEAKATLKQIKDKFPDAFIVAYQGDRLLSTAEALQLVR